MNTQIRTCYIAASSGTNLDVIRRALDRRRIQVRFPTGELDGGDLQAEIRSIISEVDLVIGVLTTERRSVWALFELGVAWAAKKRIMLITSSKNDFVPSVLQRFLVLRSSPRNAEAIGFALDQLLAAPLSDEPAPSPTTLQKSSLGPEANDVLVRVNHAVESNSGQQLEKLVAEALRKSGVDVISEFDGGSDSRADMAIWSDQLQTVTGNPILIEVKLRLNSSKELRAAASAFASQLSSAGVRWGLLLYGEGYKASVDQLITLPASVLAIDVPTLLERMRTQAFDDIVKDLRNRKVHGSIP